MKSKILTTIMALGLTLTVGSVSAAGDLHIDFHHTTEDTGIAIGEAADPDIRTGQLRNEGATIVREAVNSN